MLGDIHRARPRHSRRLQGRGACQVNGARRFYRFQRIGRRIVLQLFNARPEDAPVCVFWERVRARDVQTLTRDMEMRGWSPLP